MPLPRKQDQKSPPAGVLFSHLPLHSQKQVSLLPSFLLTSPRSAPRLPPTAPGSGGAQSGTQVLLIGPGCWRQCDPVWGQQWGGSLHGQTGDSDFLLQVRSPFPMIPIGGIQMVHSLPTSVTTPLGQQGAPHAELQKSPSEDSFSSEGPSPQVRGGGDGRGSQPSPPGGVGGGAGLEQEESIHTCTKAIASLCLHSEDRSDRGGRGARASSSPPALPPDSQPHQCSPQSSPSPPEHFTGLELRPLYAPTSTPPQASICPHPPTPPPETHHRSKPTQPERDGEEGSARRLREAP